MMPRRDGLGFADAAEEEVLRILTVFVVGWYVHFFVLTVFPIFK